MRFPRVLALALLASSCASVAPVPIRAGDVCFHCRRTIDDTALAAEVISKEGHAFKFSSVACLADYLRTHAAEPVRGTFVTDHARGKLFPAEDAWFVKFTVDPKVNREDYAAFRDQGTAKAFAQSNRSEPVNWETVKAAGGVEHVAH